MSERDRADRLDPDGEFRKQVEVFGVLARPPWSLFLRTLGVSGDDIRQAKAILADSEALLETLDPTAQSLAPLGWIFFEQAPVEDYRRAAQLVRQGNVQDAEQLIVESWNGADATLLHQTVHKVQHLYKVANAEYDDPSERDVGHPRAMLIHEAVENHREGRYASSITLALTQIDGVVADFSDEGHVFFSRDRSTGEPRAALTDDETLAGHPAALAALARLMTERCDTTEITGRLLRHGILHGRELGYGTRRNSTQALATLLAVVTWAQPIARALLAAATQAREARYLGSKERDDAGRLRDRRGFAEAKKSALSLSALQDRFYERNGRYAASADNVDPGGVLADKFIGASTSCSGDGQTYMAWATAETEYVFAVSGRNGEQTHWLYAGDKRPEGGVGSPDDWRGVLDDPAHPDW